MKSVETNLTFHFVYKTENMINGKIYIGVHSSNNPNDNYLGSGKLITKAIRKYGRNNFRRRILEFFSTREEAFAKEAEIVTKEFCLCEDNYNIDTGGRGNNKTFLTPEELKNKISNTLKGRKIPRDIVEKVRQNTLGRIGINNGTINQRVKKEVLQEYLDRGWVEGTLYKMRDDLKAKISKANKGVKKSDEFRENVGKRKRKSTMINNGIENKMVKGELLEQYLSEGWVRGIIHTDEDGNKTTVSPCKGRKLSDETRMKQSKSKKGVPKPEGFGKRISEASKDKVHINNGERNTTIHISKVDEYLANGWKLGMKKRNVT